MSADVALTPASALCAEFRIAVNACTGRSPQAASRLLANETRAGFSGVMADRAKVVFPSARVAAEQHVAP